MSWVVSAGLGLALAGLVFIPEPSSADLLNPDRILAMGAIALVVSAWYGPRSRWYTATVGLVGLVTVIASGSRMASLVLVVLLVTAPGLRLPRAGRALLVVALVALIGLASTSSVFQQRWFESGEGTFFDLVTLHDLETSARFEVWPIVAEACGPTLTGHGAGASDSFSLEANAGFPEPHNEYLRVWCDTGIVGSLLLWGFVAAVAIRMSAALRQRPARLWADHAAMQLVVALALLSLTDNPLTTAIPFLVPAALVFGWSDKAHGFSARPALLGRSQEFR
jgi:O-antigen ligase